MSAGPERKKERCLLWDLSVSCAKGPAAGVLILVWGVSVLEGSQSVLHHQSVPSHGVERWA